MGTMPDCLLAGGVVVVEARGVGVKQLPPLVVVRLLSATHPNRNHRSARRATQCTTVSIVTSSYGYKIPDAQNT